MSLITRIGSWNERRKAWLAATSSEYARNLSIKASGSTPIRSDGTGNIQNVAGLNLSLEQRSMLSQQFDLWSIAMWYKLSPEQTQNFLRMGLMGDLYTQHNLFLVFEDTWPALRNAVHQLRDRASSAKYVVKPYVAKEGEEPDEEALEKATLVHAAIDGMRGAPGTDENNFKGMVYDLCNALPQGISAQELVWERRTVEGIGQERIMPKYAAWVHPQWLTYSKTGALNLLAGKAGTSTGTDMMNLGQRGAGKAAAVAFPENKFIIGTYKTRSGVISSYALYRCLGKWWSMMMYGCDWMFRNANLFGMPIRKAVYERTLAEPVLDKLEASLRTMGANGYLMIPKGVDFDMLAAAAGSSSSAIDLIERGDHYAELILLGQIRSTGTKKTQAGGNALSEGGNDTFDNIRKERIMDLAIWVGSVLTDQFARAVISLNYDNTTKVPRIEADFTSQLSEAETTQLMTAKLAIVSAPAKWVRRELNVPEPENPDDEMIGGTQTSGSQKQEQQYDENGNPIDALGNIIEMPSGKKEEPEEEIAARLASTRNSIQAGAPNDNQNVAGPHRRDIAPAVKSSALSQYRKFRDELFSQLDTIKASGDLEALEQLEASLPRLMSEQLTDTAFKGVNRIAAAVKE